MVKLSLITAETVKVFKKGEMVPCVVLIGRDENRVKRMRRIEFWPYFFIKESDFIRLSDDSDFNLRSIAREYQETSARSLDRRALKKLILWDSKAVTNLDRQFRKWGKVEYDKAIYTYEADLSKPGLLALRYLIDKGIKSAVDIREDGRILPIDDFNIPLRIWYIDFEAYSTRQCSTGPRKEVPITMVSIWDSYLNRLYTLYVVNKKWKHKVRFRPIFKNHVIKGFKTEALLLGYLIDLTSELNWDLCTAWNLDRYDIVKWFQRMGKYEALEPKMLSPLKSLARKRKPYRIKGRILFDLMTAFKRFTDAELRSYSLLYVVGKEELKSIVELKKIPFKGSPANTWDNYPQTVFKRNINDVLIIKALDEKYELIEMFNDLRKEFGALFHEVLRNYRVLDTALMRFIHGKIVLSTARKGKSIKESFLGAVVVEPIPGKYKFIAQFDFGREYPNIIRTFNIGPETYRTENYTGPCYTIKYRSHVYKFVKKPLSLLAQLITYFFRKRDLYEKEYQRAIAKGDEAKIKMWYRRIFNIKKMTNAIYGVMDFPSFRLFRKECSAATAVIGRIGIERLQIKAEKLGYKVIYGDTDSIFIELKSNTKEEAVKEGSLLAEKLNKDLTKVFTSKYKVPKAPSELGLKKIYSSFLLVAKKYYAGKYFWDEKRGWKEDYDFKGIEVIRSDSSDLERDTLETIIKMILSDKPSKDVKAYWKKITRNYWNKVYNYLEIAYPLQIVKDFSYYNHNPKEKQYLPAHIRSALISNCLMNTDFGPGDKPRRLPVKAIRIKKQDRRKEITLKFKDKMITFTAKDVSIAEDMDIPSWVIEEIDYQRIYKRLAKKIARIFKLVSIQTSLEAFT